LASAQGDVKWIRTLILVSPATIAPLSNTPGDTQPLKRIHLITLRKRFRLQLWQQLMIAQGLGTHLF
jgi:hypothetical protein